MEARRRKLEQTYLTQDNLSHSTQPYSTVRHQRMTDTYGGSFQLAENPDYVMETLSKIKRDRSFKSNPYNA